MINWIDLFLSTIIALPIISKKNSYLPYNIPKIIYLLFSFLFYLYLWDKLFSYYIVIVHFNRESDITKERIQKILNAGATVVLTTGGIDDLCLKYFVEAGAIAVRRCKKQDLKRIAKATGG